MQFIFSVPPQNDIIFNIPQQKDILLQSNVLIIQGPTGPTGSGGGATPSLSQVLSIGNVMLNNQFIESENTMNQFTINDEYNILYFFDGTTESTIQQTHNNIALVHSNNTITNLVLDGINGTVNMTGKFNQISSLFTPDTTIISDGSEASLYYYTPAMGALFNGFKTTQYQTWINYESTSGSINASGRIQLNDDNTLVQHGSLVALQSTQVNVNGKFTQTTEPSLPYTSIISDSSLAQMFSRDIYTNELNSISTELNSGIFIVSSNTTGTDYSSISIINTGVNYNSDGSSNNTITIQDAITNKGLIYANDYSTNFTDNSLVSKRWVSNFVGTASTNITVQNGLTQSSGVVKLGGALTNNTLITGLYDLDLGNNSNRLNVFRVYSDTQASIVSRYSTELVNTDQPFRCYVSAYQANLEYGDGLIFIQNGISNEQVNIVVNDYTNNSIINVQSATVSITSPLTTITGHLYSSNGNGFLNVNNNLVSLGIDDVGQGGFLQAFTNSLYLSYNSLFSGGGNISIDENSNSISHNYLVNITAPQTNINGNIYAQSNGSSAEIYMSNTGVYLTVDQQSNTNIEVNTLGNYFKNILNQFDANNNNINGFFTQTTNQLLPYTSIGSDSTAAFIQSYDINTNERNLIIAELGNGVIISASDQTGTSFSSIYINNNGTSFISDGSGDNTIVISDQYHNKGAVYPLDYSSKFTNESLVTKRYVDSRISAINTYMLTGLTSSVGGSYKQAVSLPSFVVGSIYTISTPGVSTTPTLLGEFVTNLGFPNTTVIPSGQITAHWETKKVAGSNNYYSYFELYKRSAGGVETLIATSDLSSQSAVNTTLQVTVSAFLVSNYSLLVTDRLVIKIYGVMVASTATIELNVDDNTDARISIPATFVDPSIYVPYTNALSNLDINNHKITSLATASNVLDAVNLGQMNTAIASATASLQSQITSNSNSIITLSSSVITNTTNILTLSASVITNTANLNKVIPATNLFNYYNFS